jgi:uncharacterized protein YjbJ (UPF0337 family)
MLGRDQHGQGQHDQDRPLKITVTCLSITRPASFHDIEERAMGSADKARNKGEEIKGKIKETTGKAAGNEEMEAEGETDQDKGNMKQAGEKIKDAFKD